MPAIKQNKGLTLIEVLIALAILSIALTAIIKAASENIENTLYLQNKMAAHFAGMNMLNQIETKVLSIPPDNNLHQSINLLQRNFELSAELSKTPNPRIQKILVEVSLNNQPIEHLISYDYEQ